MVQSTSHHAHGGVDRTTKIYDFVGKVIKTKTSHDINGANARTVDREFECDHVGRLLITWHKVDTTEVLLAQNVYNDLGQPVEKKLHSTESRATADASRTYKQKTDYRYNISGWMTSINDLESTQDVTDLFGMNLLIQY